MRIQRDDLREVVEIAAGAVAKRSILPVLGCLRLGWGAGLEEWLSVRMPMGEGVRA